jgi:Helix-turn-helix domain
MNYTHLTREERYQIYALKKAGHSQSEIATVIDRSVSTISRELARNCGARGYRPKQAHNKAVERKAINARAIDDATWQFAQEKLMLQWSPDQISNYADISIETVYQRVYADKRNGGFFGRICAVRSSAGSVMARQIGAASSPTANPLSNVRLSSMLEVVSATGRQIPSSARTTGRPSSAWSSERRDTR